MDSPNTKISRENWSLVVVRKFIAERIISYRNRNENSGILLTNREFHLQTGNLAYKTGFSFTKRESWVTKGILGLLFTCSFLSIFLLNIKSSKFAMFRLKNEKTLRIFSSILKSYKREKHLQPFRLFINFIKMCKKVLEIVTMICYNVSAFIKR